jgi:hypothetical protein
MQHERGLLFGRSADLIVTKHMVGRVTASQIACASLASFFSFLRYGRTN